MRSTLHIVIVARHHNEPGSGGARRPGLLAKALRERGHTVRVVSPHRGNHSDDIFIPHPATHTGKSVPTVQASSIRERIKAPIRKLLLWPEPDIRWAKRVVAELPDQVERVDIILTTSPPESVHYVGYALARELGAQWHADFRDTWTLRPHRQNVRGLRAVAERALARYWLRHVDRAFVVDSLIKADVGRALPPDTTVRVIGHFSEPFEGTALKLPEDMFNLVHAGGFSLSDHRRRLAPLVYKLRGARSDLCLHVAGRLTDEERLQLSQAPFETRYHGLLDLEESRALQAGADALLLYTPNPSDALPGKVAEYVASGRPIVLIGDPQLRNRLPVETFDLQNIEKANLSSSQPCALSDALSDFVDAIERA